MKSLNEAAAQMLATATNGVVEQELDHLDDEYMTLKMALPKGVDIKQAIEYGFYEHKHRYWMRRGGDMRFESISNFTMKVLYLIEGANPKRIVEIRNVYGITRTIDMGIEDMISLDKFKFRVESLGNFIFEGKATDLTRIKTQLLNNERSAIEISRMGQYKNHFWAWANGIYTGTAWIPTDDRGMVEVDGQHYFIPVMSNTAADNDEDLRNYRKFLHREGSVTFKQWGDLFCTVYGENGRMEKEKNKIQIEDVRLALMDTIQAVRAGAINIDQARAIEGLARVMVDTAKVEVDYLRIITNPENRNIKSEFLPEKPKELS